MDCVVPENIHTPPWKEIRNSKGEGVLSKLLEEKYEAKLEFSGG